MPALALPSLVRPLSLVITFITALSVFHLILVFIWRLERFGWRIVDYIWLCTAFLGVLGSFGAARQIVAADMKSMAQVRLESYEKDVHFAIAIGTSPIIHRRFVRTEYSPPQEELERIQREYDELYAWFKEVQKRAPTELSKRTPLTLPQLGGSPPPPGADQQVVQDLAGAISQYNIVLDSYNHLIKAANKSDTDEAWIIIGPYIFVLALALRITKITGEARLDRRSGHAQSMLMTAPLSGGSLNSTSSASDESGTSQ